MQQNSFVTEGSEMFLRENRIIIISKKRKVSAAQASPPLWISSVSDSLGRTLSSQRTALLSTYTHKHGGLAPARKLFCCRLSPKRSNQPPEVLFSIFQTFQTFRGYWLLLTDGRTFFLTRKMFCTVQIGRLDLQKNGIENCTSFSAPG